MKITLIALLFAVSACGADAATTPDASRAPTDAAAAPTPDAPVPDAAAPQRERLSQVGLYDDLAGGVLAAGVVEFAPNYALWSDDAAKTRWIKLPPGTRIDTSDMDRWSLPVGTRMFKEFVRDGVRVETRMIEKLGDGPMDYWMGAFIWLPDQSDAVFAEAGGDDVLGTPHDVPDAETCWTCHLGETSRYLGFSAVQLWRDGDGDDVTVARLAADDLLTDPPPPDADYAVPGDDATRAALGYLHANCGHCHNPRGTSWPDTDMWLRLEVADRTPEATTTWRSAVGVPLSRWMPEPYELRIAPGSSATSGVVARMVIRGTTDQMPPIATEDPHTAGIAAVSAWIDALPAD